MGAARRSKSRLGAALRAPLAWLALLPLVALCASGCQTPLPENQLATGHSGAEAQHVLVLPINVFLRLPPDLAESAVRVERVLQQYLVDRGKTVEYVSLESAQRAWREAVQAAAEAGELASEDTGAGDAAAAGDAEPPVERAGSGEGAAEGAAAVPPEVDFDAALARLAPTLAREHRFDALLIPAIVARPAVLMGQQVSWDGVTRQLEAPVPMDDRASETSRFVYNTPYLSRREIQAPSLWARVALPDGTQIFQGFGGLDLLIQSHWFPPKAVGERPRYGLVPVDVPFADREALREGVAVALHPYLPLDESAE